MDSEIEKRLFDIPPGVEFPLELSVHLKSKLHGVMDQNWHLKRHIDYLDKEVTELRKFKTENNQDLSPIDFDKSTSSSLMASKIVELSKKNRDMTAQIESMKTKMKKLMSEIDKQRPLQVEVNQNNIEDDQSHADSVSTSKPGEGTISSSQHLTQLTNKMMEYRRQCQQLKMELRSALRALSQEIGEGVTPQTVLSMTTNNSWRGRQQQIISLQQKVADLQIKLSKSNNSSDLPSIPHQKHGFNGEGDSCAPLEQVGSVSRKSNFSFGSEKAMSSTSTSSMFSSVTQPHRNGLLQHDMRKQEQISKLTHQLEKITQDLGNRQQELKSSKARIQTLESQTKSFRSQIEILESRLSDKDTESKSSWVEMSQLKQELSGLKDREKRSRDKTSLEIQEANRALTRERAIVVRLQKVIAEKQEALQMSDGEMIELRNKLELCCSNNNVQGGLNAIDRIQDLEMQLTLLSDTIATGDNERQRLLEAMNGAITETEEVRQKVVQAQRKSVKVFTVLQQADKCIDDCLDAAQITNTSLLQEVENIRTLIRELKTGELYSFNPETDTGSVKKLRTKIGVLNSEVQVLQNSLQELAVARKSDLDNYARISEQMKRDLGAVFKESSNNKR